MATPRQKKAFKLHLEKGGPVGPVLREAGYSEAMVHNPGKVSKTKGWQELMDEYLPDEYLMQRHHFLLENENTNAQAKALDMAYKLKGNYAPEKKDVLIEAKNKDISDEELDAMADEVAKKLKDKKTK